MSDLIKCKTLAPVMHNGTLYSVGAYIELTLHQYESLLSIEAVATADANPTSDTNKGNAGVGNNPPAPEDPQVADYASKTNNEQLTYLETLNDEDFKLQAENLLPVSKSKSKTYIERRLKLLVEGAE